MGTRSTITFTGKIDDKEVPYVRIYQQYDGYLEGVGLELICWLKTKNIVNGISDYTSDIANGLGCLAAQYVRDYKDGVGDLYIDPIDSDLKLIDYNYDVVFDLKSSLNPKNNKQPAIDFITIRVRTCDDSPFFVGTPAELAEYIDKKRREAI